ncbi:hypothetical protein STAQ_27960 [Allostella sp. ATCC 35155]|nr:hypothetical protein STAQ_27960 [Stella sp. ATCC 35155]
MTDPALDLRLSAIEESLRRLGGELADVRCQIETKAAADGATLAQAIDLDILAGRMAEAGAR